MNKAFYIIVLLLLCGLATKEQVIGPNLVNNPSFEEKDTCPEGSGNLYVCKYWWGLSTEYFNACAPATLFSPSVPLNGFGFQYANNGVAYAGLGIYQNSSIPNYDYREAIKTKLNNTLIANRRYCTDFYITLTQYSYRYPPNNYIFLDSIGMLFTNNSVQDSVLPILSNGIKVQNDIFNLDTVHWLKISNSFKANGGEQYLTIGNFDNIVNWPNGKNGVIYVYVDDVSVCECSFNFSLGNDTTLCIGESLILKPNMPNATYTWQDGSTNSTYTVTQPGTYWVKAYFADYNITTTDTINIMYKNCDSVNPNTPAIYIPSAFSLIGHNNTFKILTEAVFSTFKMEIYYRWYGLAFVSEDKNKGWDGTYRGKPVPMGLYLYHITGTIKDTGEKIEKIGTVTLIR
ncbi:MAG: gliding motility-associated C-terminal domain-containing protein [Bacteroidota bacterium]